MTRRPSLLVVAALATLPAATAFAGPNVVLLLGEGDVSERTIVELTNLEHRLAREDASIALAHGEETAIVFDRPLGEATGELAKALRTASALRRSPLTADLVEAALDVTPWAQGSPRSLVLVDRGRALSTRGRTTIEEVVFHADARRVLMALRAEAAYLADPSNTAFADVGTPLAAAILAPRRLPPSRR